MNYELAKQLKDAGFPQEKSGFVYYTIKTGTADPVHLIRARYGLTGYSKEEVLDCIDAPTLSELIEACGSGVALIIYNPQSAHAVKIQTWTESHGSNPDEALAKLWLALNMPKMALTAPK